jgi:DNA-binding response OmpR family regulator
VVDPDPATHDLVLGALGEECAVFGARSRSLGITVASRRHPDVVIIDDGIADLEALVSELGAAHANVRFVFLVATGRPREETSALTALGSVVARPVDPERLTAVVRSVVRLRAMTVGVQRMRTTGTYKRPQRRE